MPTIYVKQQNRTQQGYNNTGASFTNNGANYGLGAAGTRVQIVRFSHIPVPKGSTITSATLHMAYSGKNNTGSPYAFTQRVYLDTQLPSKPLDTTRNEWTTPLRTWTLYGSTSSWAFQQGTANSRQLHSHNVKPHLDAAITNAGWTTGGGSASFLMDYPTVSHPDYIYMHTGNDIYPPVLEINYVEPVSDGKQTVVNMQENPNFLDTTVNSANAASIFPISHNTYFGAYPLPAYSVVATPAPPFGGNALRVQATTGTPTVILGIQNLEDGEWYNHSCHIYIPASAPAGFEVLLDLTGDKGQSAPVTARGQWVRRDLPFIFEGNSMPWTNVLGRGSATWNNTSEYYVANVQLTKGRLVRPYIDGAQTATNADYGWACPNNVSFVRAVPPSATVVPQNNKARRKYYAVNWDYASPAQHPQVLVDVQVGKVGD